MTATTIPSQTRRLRAWQTPTVIIVGGLADKFGSIRVISTGAVLYGLGLALMAYSDSPAMLNLSAGVLIGFGLAGCSFNLGIGAPRKVFSGNMRVVGLWAGP